MATSPARIYRDAHGVPHVRAGSVRELAFAQGEVTARDRAWQLEWQRRRASGTTAELLGPSAVGWDTLARRTRIADTARRAHGALGAESRAFVAAYVAGVNAGLHADAPELIRLGVEPQPWEDWTPLAVFCAQHLLFAGLGGRLWKRRSDTVLGADARLLSHEGPGTSGSNAWAVGGARTASGRPLIGGDPHRVIESPGVYQQVRLACEDPDDEFDVVGFTFPGVPGVQHFAHAGEVAWAITNAMADYQDVHEVQLDEHTVTASYAERVPVAGHGPVDIEVLVTDRGPVFEGGRGGPGLVLQQACQQLGDLGFEALLPLLRARTVGDVDRALDRWVEPVNNAVIADVHGRVLYRVAGRVPTRDADGVWTGWVDPLPRTEVAPDGQVVSANERRGPESRAIGSQFAPPYRARRLHALLDGRDDLEPADFEAFHNDTVLLATGPMHRLLDSRVLGADETPFAAEALAMRADSLDAGRLAAWRTALARLLAAEPVLAPLHEPTGHDPLFAPWLDVTARVGLALPALLAEDHPLGIDVVARAREAWAQVRDHRLPWGETHVLSPVHAFDAGPDELVGPPVPALPLDGDSDCVRCTGSAPGIGDQCSRGSVARYVWDLADRQRSGWVVPMGASGHPDHPHHLDQLPLWVEGRLAPVVTDWARLVPEDASQV